MVKLSNDFFSELHRISGGDVYSDGKGNTMTSSGTTYNEHTGKVFQRIVARKHSSRKRYRATVVVIRDGKLLLVRDKGRHDFSMPGGGFHKGESTVQASIREVGEELGLKSISAVRLRDCDLDGERAHHKVCQLTIQGDPYIRQPHEIDKIIWWDMKSALPVQGHVKYILSTFTERWGK